MDRRAFLAFAATASAMFSLSGCSSNDKPSSGGSNAVGQGIPGDDYFKQLAADLTAQGYGTPQIVIDLDRLDANADAIANEIGRDRYRIVEKSLPSIDLLSYVRDRTGARRFLVLHLPFLPALLSQFSTDHVLVGKVQPILAVKKLFASIRASEHAATAARVQFVVDSRTRLDELAALASSLSVTMNVGIEIDVGLHRGGVRRPSDLRPVLEGFAAHPNLRFGGLLGYDGHIIGAPMAPGLEKAGVVAAYRSVEEIFKESVDLIKSDFGSLWRDDLIFNSGGTSTYPLHHDGVVNDVAAGGGMLRPASYSDMFISALSPALFIAAPVIAQFDKVELPFVNNVGQATTHGQQSAAIYGGGWAAVFVHPHDVALAPLVSDPENMNLVPNQTLITAPDSLSINPGDWVFQHPRLADAIFQFEEILLVRGGRLQTAKWGAYPRRY